MQRSFWKRNCIWSCKFFHGFLASADGQQVLDLINKLRKEADSLEKSLVEIAVYSGGSITWQDAYMMSAQERNVAVKVINKYNKLKAGKADDEF